MSWFDLATLVVGALLGVLAGVLLERPFGALLDRALFARFRRRRHRKTNAAWTALQSRFPGLLLVQGGWGPDGYFAEGTAVLRLGGTFALDSELANLVRLPHEPVWTADGQRDNWQVGIDDIASGRVTDEPGDSVSGRSHQLVLEAHSFRYFDYLATHQLRLRGSAEERARLDDVVGVPDPDTPVDGFPNPCSVGLSLFCEGGTKLVLTRRTRRLGSGGHWQAGKRYNAVGETACPRDFVALFDQPETTPQAVAIRGLHEEMGFGPDDVRSSPPRIHSFAWASDLLDHKFFGSVVSPLSESETIDRWRNAHDAGEASAQGVEVWAVDDAGERRRLLESIRDEATEWSPEAIFCTIRSLTVLGLVPSRTVTQVFG